MKKIIMVVVMFGSISLLQGSSQNSADQKENASQPMARSRGWANDVLDRRLSDDDMMSSEELVEFAEQGRQRRVGSHENQQDELSPDTLASQAEQVKKNEERAKYSLVGQWQRFFAQIMAYFYSK